MIKNIKQYKITQKWAEKFRLKILECSNIEEEDPILHKAFIDGMQSQLEQLTEELKEWESKAKWN